MPRRSRRVLLLCLLGGVAAGVAAGATVVFGGSSTPSGTLGAQAARDVPTWVEDEHLPRTAVAGATVFAVAGCTACHTYDGSGRSALNAPDLTSIGSHRLGIGFEIRFLRCPTCVNPGSPMPHFERLGAARLRQLAVFLEASKGAR